MILTNSKKKLYELGYTTEQKTIFCLSASNNKYYNNITKLRCPLLQQLAVSGGSQILTSGEHISRFVETQIGGKMLMAFS